MQNTKKVPFDLIAAIILTVLAVFDLFGFLGNLGHQTFLSVIINLVSLAGAILILIPLYQKKKDTLLAIGFALLAVVSLYSFIAGFFNKAYFEYEYRGLFLESEWHFAPLYILPRLVALAGYAGAFALAALYTTGLFPQYRDYAKKLWFVPAACLAANALVLPIISLIFDMNARFSFGGLLEAIAFLGVAIWLAEPECLEHLDLGAAAPADGSAPAQPTVDGYCSLGKHIVLLLFTFGIWMYIWIYRTTRYLNRTPGEAQRNPATELLLCMFIPFYSIFWTYKTAQRVDKLAGSDLTTICLILSIFIGIVPPIILQDKINAIAGGQARPAPAYQAPTPAPAPAPAPEVTDVPAELKKYKELLDSGVITQEDYDAKKKQLLGL